MSTNYESEGQYNMVKLSLTTKRDDKLVLDLRPSFYDITIYESLYSFSVSGIVSLVDSFNLVNDFGLGNGEKIEIEIYTAGADENIIEYTGYCYKVSEPQRLNEHANGFLLYFTSKEKLNSTRDKLFGSYQGSTDQIARQIFSRISDKENENAKSLITEPSLYLEKFNFTGETPEEAIRMISDKSISNSSSFGFVFYEDMDSYKFFSYQQLFKQEPVSEYYYRNAGSYGDVKNRTEESFNSYQDFAYEPRKNMAEKLKDGDFGSQYGFYDMKNKQFYVERVDVYSEFKQTNMMGKEAYVYSDMLNENRTDKLSIRYSGSVSPGDLAEPHSRITKMNAENMMFNIGVFGDSSIRVGYVVRATIPTWSSYSMAASDADLDFYTGNFLIAEIKHVITQEKYTQRFKLIKNSFEGKIK